MRLIFTLNFRSLWNNSSSLMRRYSKLFVHTKRSSFQMSIQIYNKSCHWLNMRIGISEIQVILNSSGLPGFRITRTGEDHRLLGFLLMNPFFSNSLTCWIMQSLCLGRFLRALALLGRHLCCAITRCLGNLVPRNGAWPIVPRPETFLLFQAFQ